MNREDLKKYRYNQKWIDRQLERYREQKAIVENISSTLDGMPKAKNKPNYKLEELMDSYDEIIDILIRDQEKQNEIMKAIRLINEPYRTILTDKYIDDMSLEDIADEIGYSYYRTCRMHGTALNLFDELSDL